MNAARKSLYRPLVMLMAFILGGIETRSQNLRPVRIEAGVSWTVGIDADDFFRDYQVVFGGKSSSFEVPTGFYASLGSYQLGEASIGVSTGYYRATMRENYNYSPVTSDTSFGPPQNISQDMALSCVPAMVTVDFYPFKRQFTGYLGAGVGASFTSFRWTEQISASQSVGARTGGTRYDDTHITPAVSARVGVSLGLDNELGKDVRAAVVLEGGYLYLPLTAPLMADASESFATATPSRLQGDYNVQAGGFQFKIGLSVFIVPRK